MAPIISAAGVGKTFRQLKRRPGLRGAISSLFSRQYTEIRAVDGVSFTIAPGEAVGYLGPNGAGKSTMIKMMTGILTPSAGALSVLGREPHANRVVNAREIGVVFGQRSQLWWDLPVSWQARSSWGSPSFTGAGVSGIIRAPAADRATYVAATRWSRQQRSAP